MKTSIIIIVNKKVANYNYNSSIEKIIFFPGSLAQWLEQFAHNELVVGSNPTGPTKVIFAILLNVLILNIKTTELIIFIY